MSSEFFTNLRDASFAVLAILIFWLPAWAVVYLFRVSAGSKRVPLVADVIRVGSLLLAAIFVYSLARMGACTGCGLVLVGVSAVGIALGAAGMRIDGLWRHPSFWITLSLAFVLLVLWLCPTVMLTHFENDGWCLILSALGSFALATLPLPVARIGHRIAYLFTSRRR